MLNLIRKKEIVSEIRNMVCKALSVVLVNFSGVTADGMNKLRKMCRDFPNVYVRVIRNSLMKRILGDTQFHSLQKEISGPTLIGLSFVIPNDAVRLFLEYSADDANFKIISASFEGRVFSVSTMYMLSNMPTYECRMLFLVRALQDVAIGKIMRVFLMLCDKNMK